MQALEAQPRVGRPLWLGRVLLSNVPDRPAAVELVVAQHPVANKERSIRRHRKSDWSKVLAALHERQPLGGDTGPIFLHTVALNAMIRPRGHEQVAEIVRR